MALISNPPKGPSKIYSDGMTSTEANDWLNENIQLSTQANDWLNETIQLTPYRLWTNDFIQEWIHLQDEVWTSHTGISPMELVLGLPPEQRFVGESAREDYGSQAGNLNSLDFRDPTQPSHIPNTPPHIPRTPPEIPNPPPSLEREHSWHKASPSPRPRVESANAGMSFDIETVLEGPLTRINLASDCGPEAGPSEEGEMENEGMLEDRNSEEMHLSEGEDHRADGDASNLRDLRANLPLNRDEEGRAGLGQGRRVNGNTRRRRRRRAFRRRVDRWVPDNRHHRADRWVPDNRHSRA